LKSSLRLSPLVTEKALQTTQRWDPISAEDILEDDPRTWRAASNFILREDRENEELLRKCLEGLRCDLCESNAEESRCQYQAAEIAYQLKEFDLAFENYDSAVELNPDNADRYHRYITRLKEAGRRDQARWQARVARKKFPQDDRFDEIIEKMAREDLGQSVPE
jgi:tetratricopeptide (TPR) repeat protein